MRGEVGLGVEPAGGEGAGGQRSSSEACQTRPPCVRRNRTHLYSSSSIGVGSKTVRRPASRLSSLSSSVRELHGRGDGQLRSAFRLAAVRATQRAGTQQESRRGTNVLAAMA